MSYRLHEDSTGDLWLCLDSPDDAGPDKARLLGRPRDALYNFVPQSLWPQLTDLIEAREAADRAEADYRREIKATYRSLKL